MKRFLIILAFGLATSEKLDRTYLPPPGAHLSGGILGDGDVPLEAPRGPGLENIGDGTRLNFGDKIPKVPVTTTSYAFSTTTTYPVTDGYQTTTLPIDPVTGLPIIVDQNQGNFPYGLPQGQQSIQNVPVYGNIGQQPGYGTNVQPGFPTQGPSSSAVTIGNPSYDQALSQYPGQNTPNGVINISGSQFPGQNQGTIYNGDGTVRPVVGQNAPNYGTVNIPGSQITGQNQDIIYNADGTIRPAGGQNVSVDGNNKELINPYPGQNVSIPGGTQNAQYSIGQTFAGQPGILPSTAASQVTSTNVPQYGGYFDGAQGSYSGQPINVFNPDTLQQNQNYQNQQQQYPGNQKEVTAPTERTYQLGSTPAAPGYYNGVSSTEPTPSIATPSAIYPSNKPVYRTERPQAAADRNAVILNYENIRTPNGYSYSYDTSNGIHADETGIVDNGTKAQGSYSYTGDDGKVYTVTYTADENGFQPRGDHIPTSPPIPEAIQRVIEQAAKDKAAGIFDDGSYDEAKYGDNKYLFNGNRGGPVNRDRNRFGNKQKNGIQNNNVKLVAGLNDSEYYENVPDNNKNINVGNAGVASPMSRPSNQMNAVTSNKDSTGANRFLSGKETPAGYNNDGALNTGEENKQINDFESRPGLQINENNINRQKQFDSKNGDSFAPRKKLDKVKEKNINYPGSQRSEPLNYSEADRDILIKPGKQKVVSGKPSAFEQANEGDGFRFESEKPAITINAASINSNMNLPAQKGIGLTEINPQDGITSLSDYLNKANQAASRPQITQNDKTAYNYQPPQTRFEQNKYPSRFSPEVVSSAMKPDQQTESRTGTTPRPFITPNVYDQNDSNDQSNTRRPFTTSGVTSPAENNYTDYEDGDDYATDRENDYERNDATTRGPVRNKITSPTYQPSETTLRPQYTPSGQTKQVTQGTQTPGYNADRTASPTGYVYGPTTPMPSQKSGFGSTQAPRRMQTSKKRPSPTVPSVTAVGLPVVTGAPTGTKIIDSKYQTSGPIPGVTGSNVVAGYPNSGTTLGFRNIAPGSTISQGYPSTTLRPVKGYTTVAPTLGYGPGTVSTTPSTAYDKSYSNPNFKTGYSYGPPKVPFYTPTTPSTTVTSTPGYQTTYQRNPGFSGTTPQSPSLGTFVPSQLGFTGTTPQSPTLETFVPSQPGFTGTTPQSPTLGAFSPSQFGFTGTSQNPTSGKFTPYQPGFVGTTPQTPTLPTFITSQPGITTPNSSPYGVYQGNYQNGLQPSTTTSPIFGSSNNPILGTVGQSLTDSNGYQYGPSTPFPTAGPTSSIGITPGSFSPTTVSNGILPDSQGYSTTYRPGFQTSKGGFVRDPAVDGFGRPIATDQQNLYSGFIPSNQGSGFPNQGIVYNGVPQGTDRPGDYLGPVNNGQSTTYPGSYGQEVIGEDFSGPKQPQRFDPKTGYHYK